MHSSLPVAGFAVAEAATMAEAVEIVSRTPCAVAHGVVEVWPLEQTPQADPATRSWSRSSSSHDLDRLLVNGPVEIPRDLGIPIDRSHRLGVLAAPMAKPQTRRN